MGDITSKGYTDLDDLVTKLLTRDVDTYIEALNGIAAADDKRVVPHQKQSVCQRLLTLDISVGDELKVTFTFISEIGVDQNDTDTGDGLEVDEVSDSSARACSTIC